jgi:CBS domain-containing protein
VGVFSERDLTRLVASNIPLNSPVDEYMKRDPVVLNENATVRDAIDAIMKYGVRHLPILDEKRRVVGIISIRDLMRFV